MRFHLLSKLLPFFLGTIIIPTLTNSELLLLCHIDHVCCDDQRILVCPGARPVQDCRREIGISLLRGCFLSPLPFPPSLPSDLIVAALLGDAPRLPSPTNCRTAVACLRAHSLLLPVTSGPFHRTSVRRPESDLQERHRDENPRGTNMGLANPQAPVHIRCRL